MRQSLSHRKMIPKYKDDNTTRATWRSCLDLQLWYFILGSGEEMCQNHSNHPFRLYSRAVDTGRQIALPLRKVSSNETTHAADNVPPEEVDTV